MAATQPRRPEWDLSLIEEQEAAKDYSRGYSDTINQDGEDNFIDDDSRGGGLLGKVIAISLGMLVAFLVIVFVALDFTSPGKMIIKTAMEDAAEWIRERPDRATGMCAAVIAVATTLFVPWALLSVAAGLGFGQAMGLAKGLAMGSVSVALGVAGGSVMSFALGRFVVKNLIKRYVASSHTKAIKTVVETIDMHNIFMHVLLRVGSPAPFATVNYILGATPGVGVLEILAGGGAIIPALVLLVHLGTGSAAFLKEATHDPRFPDRTWARVVGASVIMSLAALLCAWWCAKAMLQDAVAREGKKKAKADKSTQGAAGEVVTQKKVEGTQEHEQGQSKIRNKEEAGLADGVRPFAERQHFPEGVRPPRKSKPSISQKGAARHPEAPYRSGRSRAYAPPSRTRSGRGRREECYRHSEHPTERRGQHQHQHQPQHHQHKGLTPLPVFYSPKNRESLFPSTTSSSSVAPSLTLEGPQSHFDHGPVAPEGKRGKLNVFSHLTPRARAAALRASNEKTPPRSRLSHSTRLGAGLMQPQPSDRQYPRDFQSYASSSPSKRPLPVWRPPRSTMSRSMASHGGPDSTVSFSGTDPYVRQQAYPHHHHPGSLDIQWNPTVSPWRESAASPAAVPQSRWDPLSAVSPGADSGVVQLGQGRGGSGQEAEAKLATDSKGIGEAGGYNSNKSGRRTREWGWL